MRYRQMFSWLLALFVLTGCAPATDDTGAPAELDGAASSDESSTTTGTGEDAADHSAGDDAGAAATDSASTEALATDNAAADAASSEAETRGDTEAAPDRATATTAETSAAEAPDPASSRGESTELQPVSITLGGEDLTMGIPGEGDLTLAEIKAFVNDPENHRPIDPALPMGLNAAANNVQHIDQNPLTRAKVELGRQLYFDPRLSSDGSISCASCHHPDEGYGRHTQFGVGVQDQTGNRNSPVSYNRIVSGPQFWDGRAASLEEQAGGPIANPIEMGNTHEKALATLKDIEGYRVQFEKVFPDQGITLDTVTKAIASFERTIVTNAAPYDHYERVLSIERAYGEDLDILEEEDPELYAEYQKALAGSEPMSESAKRGRDLFFSDRVGCTACHAGANFTDEKYHNLGVGMDAEDPDLGRYAVTNKEEDKGAFKTPTLRNVVYSAPYMHDGSQQTLAEVVEWYNIGGHPNPYLSDKIKKLDLTEQEKADLVAFMKEGLTSEFTPVEPGRLPL